MPMLSQSTIQPPVAHQDSGVAELKTDLAAAAAAGAVPAGGGNYAGNYPGGIPGLPGQISQVRFQLFRPLSFMTDKSA